MTRPSGLPLGVAERLQRASSELKDLEVAITSGDIDARILLEFREAVNHVRQTAWAIQKWLDLREQHQDPFDVLTMVVAERIRVGTQLCHDLTMDANSQELTMATPGLDRLYAEAKGLVKQLESLMRAD